MCSQRTRSADIGLLGGSDFSVPLASKAATTSSASAGFGEIIDRAHLHRGHGGGDVAVAGQHDGARLGALALQRRHHVEAVAVAEPQIDHGEGRRRLADLRQAVGDAVAGGHGEAAGFHGARQALQKRLVVLHDQERAVGVVGQFGDGVHGSAYPLMSDYTAYGVAARRCQGRTRSIRLRRSDARNRLN